LMAYHLMEGLIKDKKFAVTVYASADSQTSARIRVVAKKELRKLKKDFTDPFIQRHLQLDFAALAKEAKNYDLIHNHTETAFLPFADLIKTPVITTMHGTGRSAVENLVYRRVKNNHLIAISKKQIKNNPHLKFAGQIYNGINVEKFPFNAKPKDYLLWLGRIAYIKGTHLAIEVAKKARKRLIIAGNVDEIEKEYFQTLIKPHLRSKKINFVGEVKGKEKMKLLKNAEALLAPILWEEPFGLVMVEAMACGTPVIAFNRGSVPEIIEDGRTGFIVENTREAVQALKKIKLIKRENCRKRVEKMFSQEKMVENYEKVYQRILRKRK